MKRECPKCGQVFEKAYVIEKVWHEVWLVPEKCVNENAQREFDGIIFVHDPGKLTQKLCYLWTKDAPDTVSEWVETLFFVSTNAENGFQEAEATTQSAGVELQFKLSEEGKILCPLCGKPIERIILTTYDTTVYEWQDGAFVLVRSGGDAEKPEADPCGCRLWEFLDLVGM